MAATPIFGVELDSTPNIKEQRVPALSRIHCNIEGNSVDSIIGKQEKDRLVSKCVNALQLMLYN